MIVLELKAILSRLDPKATVMITMGPPKGNGSFSNHIASVALNRTTRDGHPVVTLHALLDLDKREWTAIKHGEVREGEGRVNLRVDDCGDACTFCWRHPPRDHETLDDLFEAGYARLLSGELGEGWSPVVFESKEQASGFAKRRGWTAVW